MISIKTVGAVRAELDLHPDNFGMLISRDTVRELLAHIERWSGVQIGVYKYEHKKLDWIDDCLSCRLPWPCPTEVVKSWKELEVGNANPTE